MINVFRGLALSKLNVFVGPTASSFIVDMRKEFNYGDHNMWFEIFPENSKTQEEQADIAEYLMTILNHEHQLVLRTESEILISAIRLKAVKGEIPCEDIKLFYISQSGVEEAQCNEYGNFNPYPEGLCDIAFDLSAQILLLAMEKHKKQRSK